ncbi:MAG: MtrAB system histidine kinase MtrB [Ornithinimicrobium sp.]
MSDTKPELAKPSPVASTLASVARSIRSRLLAWWRSSLRLRVIAATLVAGTILAAALGTLLYQRVAVGLVEQAVARAEADAAQQVQQAQELFDATDRRDDFGLSAAAVDTVNQVVSGGQGDNRRAVLVQSLDTDRDTLISPVTFGGLDVGDVPPQLREALQQTPGLQQVVVTRVPDIQTGEQQTAVSVASRVQIPRAGPYDLVLIYPLDREQEILDLIREWFLIGGIGLALLVSGLAWLAARLVTDPVGQAAAVSQDLARGELDERMEVNGTDELARLATSFNTMADSLQHQIQQLEQLSLVQQRFVSDVSHELRTPLTTIRMAGEVLHASRDDFSAPVSRSAELLYSELDRFEDLLTELLEISRYDSGAMVMEAQPGDIVGLAHAVIDSVEPFASREGSEIRVMDSPPIIVEMDSRRVSRVLRNLLMNAVEHGESKPIDVAFHYDEKVAAVSVRDHGIGLEADQREQVFERFWRADTARTRTTGGTGLGLAIAREDALLHGGRLEAAGRPHEGACFRLTLPRHTGETLAPRGEGQAPDLEELSLEDLRLEDLDAGLRHPAGSEQAQT